MVHDTFKRMKRDFDEERSRKRIMEIDWSEFDKTEDLNVANYILEN